jgi:hypothetical protein
MYKEAGLSSWIGKKFNKKMTSSGETLGKSLGEKAGAEFQKTFRGTIKKLLTPKNLLIGGIALTGAAGIGTIGVMSAKKAFKKLEEKIEGPKRRIDEDLSDIHNRLKLIEQRIEDMKYNSPKYFPRYRTRYNV